MTAIILKHRWLRQPNGPTKIDFRNPLARGLVGEINAAAPGPVKVVGTTGYIRYSDRFGGGLAQTSARLGLLSRPIAPIVGSAATFVAICNLHYQGTQQDIVVALGRQTSGSQVFGLNIAHPTAGAARAVIRVADAGGITTAESTSVLQAFGDDVVRVWGAVYDGTSALKLYRDGRDDTAGNANVAATGAISALDNVALGGVDRGTDIYASTGVYSALLLAWNRALTRDEMKAVAENPWRLYRRQTTRIYSLPPASAGFHARYYYDMIAQSRIGS